jgi:hypothetical protein
MKKGLDWNYERYRTRDLLLEYNTNIMPPHPRAGGISVVYPWGSSVWDNVQICQYLIIPTQLLSQWYILGKIPL